VGRSRQFLGEDGKSIVVGAVRRKGKNAANSQKVPTALTTDRKNPLTKNAAPLARMGSRR
jgi:hypothetical protein